MAAQRSTQLALSRAQSQTQRDGRWDGHSLHHVDSLGTGHFATHDPQPETDDELDAKDEKNAEEYQRIDIQEPGESGAHDLEEGNPSPLEKSKSIKDPYLVSQHAQMRTSLKTDCRRSLGMNRTTQRTPRTGPLSANGAPL